MNRAYHSLRSKEWSSAAPHFDISMLFFRHMKKHQSLLALVQTSLCTAYRPAGKPPKRRNRCPDFALCAFTVPFLRRGFAPRFSVSAFADRVPYALFTSSIIMNLFAQFVNPFNTKRQSRSLFYQKSFLQSNFSRFRLKIVTIYYRKANSYLL